MKSNLSIIIFFHTNKIAAAKKVFNAFLKDRNLCIEGMHNLSFQSSSSDQIKACFIIKTDAKNVQELVWHAVSTMERLHVYGFSFVGSLYEKFSLIANKIGGAFGGIRAIFMEVENVF